MSDIIAEPLTAKMRVFLHTSAMFTFSFHLLTTEGLRLENGARGV